MILSQEKVGDFVILRVDENRVDATNSSALQELVSSLVAEGERKFVLDLSSVVFMDSCGLAGLIPATHELPGDGCFLLTGLHPKVEQIFRLTKLDTIFDIYPSVDEALMS
ncbi:STAS domain-containing protein [Desulfovibrio sp. JC022]|uniref:STAS domain-containing protein n=1 Tax=Desulfovibrio sp. JC022 TaxID=2593642 RepID=UPI0013D233BD|nr:STAS domain-containing protein [Desulfovibrio sp. JC022]NDV21806.1 STAS domain-containing protein [Desulfovibrio sp. JC022]